MAKKKWIKGSSKKPVDQEKPKEEKKLRSQKSIRKAMYGKEE